MLPLEAKIIMEHIDLTIKLKEAHLSGLVKKSNLEDMEAVQKIQCRRASLTDMKSLRHRLSGLMGVVEDGA